MCHHDPVTHDRPKLQTTALTGQVAAMLASEFVKAHLQKQVCCVGSRSACLLHGLP